jgi:hypothetical protein
MSNEASASGVLLPTSSLRRRPAAASITPTSAALSRLATRAIVIVREVSPRVALRRAAFERRGGMLLNMRDRAPSALISPWRKPTDARSIR